MCALFRQSSGERRGSFGVVINECDDNGPWDWTGGAPDLYREVNLEDGRDEEPLKN